MPYNGAGLFTRIYQWVNDASLGLFVDATRTDTDSNDLASGLSNCVTRDGQSPWLANLPAGGYKITGLAAGANATDSVNFSQAFTNGTYTNATFLGTVDMDGATSVVVPTMPPGDNSLAAASTAFVVQQAFNTVLPAQPGTAIPYPLISRNGVASFQGSVSPRFARATNTMLGFMDSGKFIDITSGSFTQTFDVVGNLLNGWNIRIRNSGTGNVTIALSDGVSNWIMYPGEDRNFYCDGAALYSTVNKAFSMSFTTVGANNFIKPPGYMRFGGIAWSGGASGQGFTAAGSDTYGGAAGGAFPFDIPESKFSATTVITIGAGGVGNVTPSFTGSPGGDTTIGTILTVVGAKAVSGQAAGHITFAAQATVGATCKGFEGGTAGTGIDTIYGGASSGPTVTGSSIYGGGSGGSINSGGGRVPPGTSIQGGSGGVANATGTPGSPGVSPGGGGAAAWGAASGDGARGQVDIYGIA